MRLMIGPGVQVLDAGSDIGSGARSLRPRLMLERQAESNWCWAAIAVSLGRFYGTAALRQEELAALLFPDKPRNVEARLLDALRAVACHDHWTPGRADPRKIVAMLDAGRAPVVRLQWENGDSHFVVVDGYAANAGSVDLHLADPQGHHTLVAYPDFPKSYRGRRAIWCETYWTGPNPS